MTRYDLMQTSSTQYDTKDRQPWPDPLTVDYTKFQFTEPPYNFAVDDTFLFYPYMACSAIYGEAENEDIILSVNKVPHISLMQIEQVIKLPVKKDLIAFAKKKV